MADPVKTALLKTDLPKTALVMAVLLKTALLMADPLKTALLKTALMAALLKADLVWIFFLVSSGHSALMKQTHTYTHPHRHRYACCTPPYTLCVQAHMHEGTGVCARTRACTPTPK